LDDAWDDTLSDFVVHVATHHRVRLSRSCLTIGEDCSVVSIQDVVDGGTDGVIEDIGLPGVHVENAIEGEGPGGLLGLYTWVLATVLGSCEDLSMKLACRTWIVHVSSFLNSTIGSPPLAISILFCGRNRATTALSYSQ
jgi:hypothetical protein